MSAETESDVTGLSYEQARDELVALVSRLEGGQVPLEESMRLWQRGEQLAAHCSAWLDRAEASLLGQPADSAGAVSEGTSGDDDSADGGDEDPDGEV